MGLPMAKNLVAGGFEVRGFDLNVSAIKELEIVGGQGATSAADASSDADAIILMVINADQAEAVLFDHGALQASPEKAKIILMATCPPGEVKRLASRVEAAGRLLVDAPVSGGVIGARDASLTIMLGAPSDAVEAVRPLLDAMGRKLVHVGEAPGQGAMAKAVNQLLCGIHLAAAAEAMSLCDRLGIDRKLMLDIVAESAASSWMLKDRGARMLQENPSVTSAVDIFVKDLAIVLRAGSDAKAALPISAAAYQMFLAASGSGNGSADDSQVIRAYAALNHPSAS